LLEIYALEIQMYTAQKNNKKLKALYEQSLHIKSAIPHPLIMGVIRGKEGGAGGLGGILGPTKVNLLLLLFRMWREDALKGRRVRKSAYGLF
jgi:hypothetical protein